MPKLFAWNHQGDSFADRWTLVHLAFWFVIGANMEALGMPHSWRWPAIILGAIAWEIIETGLERYTDIVDEPESYLNRWISDPIMGVVGGALGMYLVGG